MVLLDKRIQRILLFFLCFATSNSFALSVEQNIRQLSFLERHYLKAFFNKAIHMDQASHVLYYDTKPATLIAIVLQSRGKTIRQEQKAFKGWQVFKKHQEAFPHPNFIFSEVLFEPADDLSVLHIYLSNIESVRSCLIINKIYFKEILGPGFSVDDFMSQLKSGLSLPSLVNHDEFLMGLLLGFGTESSMAFKNINALNSSHQLSSLECIEIKAPQSCPIMPIMFMGNFNSQEVKKLTAIYEDELSKTWELYRKTKNPLKITLEQLCK